MSIARSVVLSALVPLALVLGACSSPPDEEAPAASEEQALIGDIESMTRLPNGDYAVRCKDGTSEIRSVAEIADQRVCEASTEPEQCVRQCSRRTWQGHCEAFAADFCAPDATCTAQCSRRNWQGNCEAYAADACGSGPQSCAIKCTRRNWQGNCEAYGPDMCGSGSRSCVKQCTRRNWQGNCEAYGQDHCGSRPSCAVHCTRRDWQGNCEAYGPDRCSG